MISPDYTPATLRSVTPVDDATAEIGIALEVQGRPLRLKLSGAGAMILIADMVREIATHVLRAKPTPALALKDCDECDGTGSVVVRTTAIGPVTDCCSVCDGIGKVQADAQPAPAVRSEDATLSFDRPADPPPTRRG